MLQVIRLVSFKALSHMFSTAHGIQSSPYSAGQQDTLCLCPCIVFYRHKHSVLKVIQLLPSVVSTSASLMNSCLKACGTWTPYYGCCMFSPSQFQSKAILLLVQLLSSCIRGPIEHCWVLYWYPSHQPSDFCIAAQGLNSQYSSSLEAHPTAPILLQKSPNLFWAEWRT